MVVGNTTAAAGGLLGMGMETMAAGGDGMTAAAGDGDASCCRWTASDLEECLFGGI